MKLVSGQWPVATYYGHGAGRVSAAPQAISTSGMMSATDQIFFGKKRERQRSPRAVADQALKKIERALAKDQPLKPADQVWLDELQASLGQPERRLRSPFDFKQWVTLDGRLTVAAINRNPKKILLQLAETLKAMRFATDYQPIRRDFGAYQLSIHNPKIAKLLKPAYTPESFHRLFQRCMQKGTFNLKTDPQTGLVKTADIDPSEDHVMVQGWITDSIRNGDWQKSAHPAQWKQALETLARYYINEQAAFEQIFKNPADYAQGGRNVGVGHIFSPETLQSFDWLAKKRLESHGLALKAFCDTIKDGLLDQQPWGFTRPEALSDALLKAVANLARYFIVLNYPEAPTTGAWEELAFNGLTSDVEAMRAGLESLSDLLFNPTYEQNPGIQNVRRRLAQMPGVRTVLRSPGMLLAWIEMGQQAVESRVVDTPEPTEHPDRPADAALAFVTTSSIRFSDDPLEDIRQHVRILAHLERTVLRDNGLIRYPSFPITLQDGRCVDTFDGYLTPNWGLAADSQGHISLFKEAFEQRFGMPITQLEPSTPDQYHTRATYALPDTLLTDAAATQTSVSRPISPDAGRTERTISEQVAEWFVIGEMAKGYALQLSKLLDTLDARQRPVEAEEHELLRQLLFKSTEYINRTYARITGENQLKANGKPCPAWKVPEAFQHVSTLQTDVSGQRKTALLPGVNTPLAWATSSLFSASQVFANALKRLDQMSIKQSS